MEMGEWESGIVCVNRQHSYGVFVPSSFGFFFLL